MDWLIITNQMFTGVVAGMILVLLALGLALIFGLMNVVNFAHGTLYMVGAYVAFATIGWTGSFWLALVTVPLAVGLIGAAIERGLVRRLYDRPEEDPILLTFGLTYIFVEIIKLIFGKIGQPVNPPDALAGAVDLGLFTFPAYLLFVVGCALAAVVGLWLLLEKTDVGLVIRAGTRDAQMVSVLGLDFDRLRVIVFAAGLALAGFAGALAAPVRGVNPDMGHAILTQSFVVVVVGGKDSYWGTVVSGLLVGAAVALTSLYFPKFSDVSMYILMALVLLLRPRGLFGVSG